MREIVDELYLFSLAPESLGKIIAQRTRTSESAEGENIFVRLGIDKDELAFLNQDDFYGRKIPRTVVCQRGGESHLVLIDTLSSHELPVGLAMEIPRPCRAIGVAYNGREQGLSPRARRLADECESKEYDAEFEIASMRSVSALFELEYISDADGDASEKLYDMLRAVSELVCLPIECSFVTDGFGRGAGPVLLHLNACLFTAVAMAMAARRYSNERKLYALISQREDFVSISLAYEGGEDEWRGEKLLRGLLGESDMICEIGTRETRKVCSMAPCYADEGLAGVKEKMNERQMLEFWK